MHSYRVTSFASTWRLVRHVVTCAALAAGTGLGGGGGAEGGWVSHHRLVWLQSHVLQGTTPDA